MSYNNPRINDLNMTAQDAIIKMAGGNPGAIRVCAELMKYSRLVDPQSMFGGLGSIMMLDTMDIYEHRIWMLYKDVCQEDICIMLAVMRAYQLGQLEGCTIQAINHAIENRGTGLDVKKIVEAVKKELPSFNVDGWKKIRARGF